jgi:hypothetical protein
MSTVPVLAVSKDDVCEGVGAASGGSGCTPTSGVKDINSVIKTALRIFQSVVGLIAVIMMITAGLRFITSSGDSAKVTSARNTLLYGAVGIVVVALSEVIIQFALNQTST